MEILSMYLPSSVLPTTDYTLARMSTLGAITQLAALDPMFYTPPISYRVVPKTNRMDWEIVQEKQFLDKYLHVNSSSQSSSR